MLLFYPPYKASINREGGAVQPSALQYPPLIHTQITSWNRLFTFMASAAHRAIRASASAGCFALLLIAYKLHGSKRNAQ